MRSKYRSHPTSEQKERLLALTSANPKLIKATFGDDFTREDYLKLWKEIADELNAMPEGSNRDWRVWRKTFQDLRYRMHVNPSYNQKLSQEEVDILAIGIKKDPSTSDQNDQLISEQNETMDMDNMDMEHSDDSNYEPEKSLKALKEEMEENPSEEEKVVKPKKNKKSLKKRKVLKKQSKKKKTRKIQIPIVTFKPFPQSNCKIDRLSAEELKRLTSQEDRKIQLQEDFLNFKKDYLQQKMEMLREQTRALHEIARCVGKRHEKTKQEVMETGEVCQSMIMLSSTPQVTYCDLPSISTIDHY